MRLCDRLWGKVHVGRPDECWPWLGGKSEGYGVIWDGARYERVPRVILGLKHGDGLMALHSCDDRGCCNPAHLRKGNHQQNMDDRQARGRAARGLLNGHAKLSDAEVCVLRALAALHVRRVRLAQLFGISDRHVGAILRGERR